MKKIRLFQETVRKESNCYLNCIDTAFELVDDEEFAKAAFYYENAARSLRELEKVKIAKQDFNKKCLEIHQNEGQQKFERLVIDLRNHV